MSGPLSPQSFSTHNRLANTALVRENLKSPVLTAKTVDIGIDGPPSSPFQTEVEHENREVIENFSPLKKPSPTKSHASHPRSFVVHEDEFIDDSLIIYSTQNSPIREMKGCSSAPDSAKPDKDQQACGMAEEVHRPGFDGRAPPQSLFDIDYSDVPRRQESMREHDITPTVVSEDTCFSTFSAIPNADMTLFANIGNATQNFGSPRRLDVSQREAPISTSRTMPRKPLDPSSRSPSPTPRRIASTKSHDGDTTNLLLDFTQQFESFSKKPQRSPQRSPQRRGGPSPTRMNTDPNLLTYLNNQRLPSPSKSYPVTPSAGKRSLMNLLDFDLPPQPTPRSIPTITARELESLKSSYLSEISSLKASLSGREAEVESLKKAVADAERRVGEALETIRDERSAREHAEKEKGEWEKKGKEVETVLQSVKEEFENAEREREDLLQKLEESSRAKAEAELRAAEATSRVHEPSTSDGEHSQAASSPDMETLVAQRVAQQLDEKMESLARELHTVYKKKHESKVATLKKTYEARSEKKCHELQEKVDELSRTRAGGESGSGDMVLDCIDHKAEISKHQSNIARLMDQVDQLRHTQEQLLHDLEQERAEKGDLVAAVDEMLALQADSQTSSSGNLATPTAMEGFRKSIGLARPSGLRAPAGLGSDSRIGKMGGVAPGIERTGSAKSRMMHNIERMGGGRAE